MVRFRVAQHTARDEHMVEVFVPSEGNDAALFLVFNSEAAAQKAATFFNDLAVMRGFEHPKQRDPQDD